MNGRRIYLIVFWLLCFTAGYLLGFDDGSLHRRYKASNSRFCRQTPTSETNTDREKLSRSIYVVMAYCPCNRCCGRWSDGYTACGHKIRYGDRFVAAPVEIPFGTMLRIPGYNNAEPVPVLDRGPENHIEVFFNNHDDALRWGVQRLDVEICR